MKAKTPVYISIGITALIVIANFGVMIRITITKIKERYKKFRLKAAEKVALSHKEKKAKYRVRKLEEL